MKKEDYHQLELFAERKIDQDVKSRLDKNFLRYLRNYERAILIIIGFVITGVVSFSLGVEKEKKRTITSKSISGSGPVINKQSGQLDSFRNRSESVKDLREFDQPVIKRDNIVKQPGFQKTPKQAKQNYTIQLATYQKDAHAQKEVVALKKRGLSPLVLLKDKYIILCVGNFSNFNTAKSVLGQLKKQYRDCFVRRL